MSDKKGFKYVKRMLWLFHAVVKFGSTNRLLTSFNFVRVMTELGFESQEQICQISHHLNMLLQAWHHQTESGEELDSQ